MMWDMGDGMGWWMLLGSVWVVLFWAGIIWLFIRVFDRRDDSRTQGEETPLNIARRRYARGEISREEFEQLHKDLGEG
jgi:putative membrane protein